MYRAIRLFSCFLLLWQNALGQLELRAMYELDFVKPSVTNALLEKSAVLGVTKDNFKPIRHLNGFGAGFGFHVDRVGINFMAKKRFNRQVAQAFNANDKITVSYSHNSFSAALDAFVHRNFSIGADIAYNVVIHRMKRKQSSLDVKDTEGLLSYGVHFSFYYKSNYRTGLYIQPFIEWLPAFDLNRDWFAKGLASEKQPDASLLGIRLIFSNGRQPRF